jgi:hypothetical protein
MFKLLLLVVAIGSAAAAYYQKEQRYYDGPANCSSNAYDHVDGKCGGLENRFLRCPTGFLCSQWGQYVIILE